MNRDKAQSFVEKKPVEETWFPSTSSTTLTTSEGNPPCPWPAIRSPTWLPLPSLRTGRTEKDRTRRLTAERVRPGDRGVVTPRPKGNEWLKDDDSENELCRGNGAKGAGGKGAGAKDVGTGAGTGCAAKTAFKDADYQFSPRAGREEDCSQRLHRGSDEQREIFSKR